jgi:hypothetical protein
LITGPLSTTGEGIGLQRIPNLFKPVGIFEENRELDAAAVDLGKIRADNLPLYDLPPIFPYRSYIGTFATRGRIGNILEKSEILAKRGREV